MIILAVIISLALLIIVHEFGHFLAAKMSGVRVDEFSFGFPPRIFSIKAGETKYSIGMLPLGGYVKIYGETAGDFNNGSQDSERSFISKSLLKRSVIVLAGIFMNIFLAWIILSGVFMVGSEKQVVITSVSENSPAAQAGIENGDVIKSVLSGGAALPAVSEPDEFIAFVKENIENEMAVKIERDNAQYSFTVRGRENPPEGEGALGVSLTGIGFESENPFSAVIHGFQATTDTLILVSRGFVDFFSNLFTKPDILKTVAGPVGIFSLATQAGSIGLIYLFQLMAVISINLAVLNFIPFPALDGGRFLFLIIEKLKGSAVSLRVESAVNIAGFAALLLLMILVTIQDIGRIL